MKKIFLILATLITSVITFNIVTPDIKATDWCYTFNTNLIKGDRGSEVEALQIALNKEGFSVPSYGDQSIFGPLTQRAVISFQEKYKAEILTPLGLSSGTGKVGVATRAKLNALYGCVSAPVPAETPAPVAGNATSYTITGPTSGTVGVPVTLTLTPNGIYSGTISIGGGSFSPTSLTWSGDASAKTFTHTPTSNNVTQSPYRIGLSSNPSISITNDFVFTASPAPVNNPATPKADLMIYSSIAFISPIDNSLFLTCGFRNIGQAPATLTTGVSLKVYNNSISSANLIDTLYLTADSVARKATATSGLISFAGTRPISLDFRESMNKLFVVLDASGASIDESDITNNISTVDPPRTAGIVLTPYIPDWTSANPITITATDKTKLVGSFLVENFYTEPVTLSQVSFTDVSVSSAGNKGGFEVMENMFVYATGDYPPWYSLGVGTKVGATQATLAKGGTYTFNPTTPITIPAFGAANRGNRIVLHISADIKNASFSNPSFITLSSLTLRGTVNQDIKPNPTMNGQQLHLNGQQLYFSYAYAPPVTGSYSFTGPTSGTVNTPATFTITPNSPYSGTIIPASTGLGTFSPTSLIWTGNASPKLFTYTPLNAVGSPHIISVFSNFSPIANPTPISFTVVDERSAISMNTSHFTSLTINEESRNFTLTPNGRYTGTVTLSTSGSGTFSPASLTWSGDTSTKIFTFTPSTLGIHGISFSSNPTLTISPISLTVNPAPIAASYTFTGPFGSQPVGTPGTFTVTPSSPYSGTITPASTGLGRFSPASLTWSGDTLAKTFTYTPTSVAGSPDFISVSSNPALTNPAPIRLLLSPPVGSIGLTVLSPNGGENFNVGDTINIRWQTQGIPATDKVGIFLTWGDGSLVVASEVINTGSYSWTIPANANAAGLNKIFISGVNGSKIDYSSANDSSDSYFTIHTAPVSYVSPSSSQSLTDNDRQYFTNQLADIASQVKKLWESIKLINR